MTEKRETAKRVRKFIAGNGEFWTVMSLLPLVTLIEPLIFEPLSQSPIWLCATVIALVLGAVGFLVAVIASKFRVKSGLHVVVLLSILAARVSALALGFQLEPGIGMLSTVLIAMFLIDGSNGLRIFTVVSCFALGHLFFDLQLVLGERELIGPTLTYIVHSLAPFTILAIGLAIGGLHFKPKWQRDQIVGAGTNCPLSP